MSDQRPPAMTCAYLREEIGRRLEDASVGRVDLKLNAEYVSLYAQALVDAEADAAVEAMLLRYRMGP